MAKGVLARILVPILVGACVAATVKQPMRDATQVMRDTSTVRDHNHDDGVSTASEQTAAEIEEPAALSVETAPAVPAHTIEESDFKAAAESFTRTIDRARIEARGALRMGGSVDVDTLRAAVPLDNGAWRGDQRRELLAYLRRGAVDKDRNAAFTEADARVVTELQAGSGANVDGVLGDETMAVLLAMGFRFSFGKPMAGEVTLEFYPGELEDLDAWKREIEQKVTKNGRGFHDVNEPDGEGTIYVRIGRSIVASYRARGGPPSPLDDGPDHVAVPTTPGTYRLGAGQPHVSQNWYYSQIPWGAEIRQNEGGYQYRWPGRTTWSWATRHPDGRLKDPLDDYDFLNLPVVIRGGASYLIWNKNDFGPIAWNLVPGDQYVHTTPSAEAEAEQNVVTGLSLSHGCIHVDPHERDEMVKRGYLGKGLLFIVRRWDEHVLPDEIRNEALSRAVIDSNRESTAESR